MSAFMNKYDEEIISEHPLLLLFSICYHLYADYVPEINHVYRVYSVAAYLNLKFLLHVTLLRKWNMFCTFTLVLSTVGMQSPIWLFFALLWFHAFPVCCSGTVWMILRWFQLPLSLLVSLLLSHSTCDEFLLMRSLYSKIFSVSYLITFLCPRIATSINMHAPFLLTWVMMSSFF